MGRRAGGCLISLELDRENPVPGQVARPAFTTPFGVTGCYWTSGPAGRHRAPGVRTRKRRNSPGSGNRRSEHHGAGAQGDCDGHEAMDQAVHLSSPAGGSRIGERFSIAIANLG
jgi:hypothetical protein